VKGIHIAIFPNSALYNNTSIRPGEVGVKNRLDIRYDTNEFDTNATTTKIEIRIVARNKIDIMDNKP